MASRFSASVRHKDIVLVELQAMHRGLELAWEHGFCDIICDTNCLEAFDLVQCPTFSRSHALDGAPRDLEYASKRLEGGMWSCASISKSMC